MSGLTLLIVPETEQTAPQSERLTAEVFGPGRFARAAFRLREGAMQADSGDGLSFQAYDDRRATGGALHFVGAVRVTPIEVGGAPALLLGPIAVAPSARDLGVGRELMNRAIHAAQAGGHCFMLLVGDLSYYGRFGFRRVPAGRITMPGPVDPSRLLFLELQPGCQEAYRGRATPVWHSSNTAAKASSRAA